MKTFNQLREELNERISGSGTDRKAVLKKAFRAGEKRRRDANVPGGGFGKGPKRGSDAGIKKAFRSGETSAGGASAKQGADRAKSQDSLAVGRTKLRDKGKRLGATGRLGLVHPNDRKKLPG